MTVKEVIEMLQTIDNKEMRIVIDCPRCGHAQEVAYLK
jgi:hypothetical protein